MQRPFRQHHILTILNEYDNQTGPLDYFISTYFRAHKALGSKDRGEIAETVYSLVRWRGLLDFACEKDLTWERRLDFFLSPDFASYKHRQEIADHVRLSFPKKLFDRLVASHGIEIASQICSISNTMAPTTIRVNTLKTTRENLMLQWKDRYQIRACHFSDVGIIFDRRVNFYELPEFKQGLFEIQDEGSQLIAKMMKVKPGQLVMDYCGGAGGKALAFAPDMLNKGQIYIHDVRKHALLDARKRLCRAGIQNAQIVYGDEAKLKKLKKKMDWVLVDAPCSGTGTMRRNPDMKWKYEDEILERLQGQQRMIFEKALSFLKPGGHIGYATCSVLNEENEVQVDHFVKTYELEIQGEPFKSLPVMNGMDGFFGIIFKRK